MSDRRWYRLSPVLVGILVVAMMVLLALPGRLVTLWWLDALGYEAVFWRTVGLRAVLFGVGFLAAAAYLGANIYLLVAQFPVVRWRGGSVDLDPPRLGEVAVTPPRLRLGGAAFAALVALALGASLAGHWEGLLRFLGTQDYGMADPLFGHDVAFYLLRLPFLDAVQNHLFGLFLVGLVAVVGVHVFLGNLSLTGGRVEAKPAVNWQVSVNTALVLGAWGWGYFLDRYELLVRPGGVVHGAGYTDVTVVLPALWFMIATTALLGLYVLVRPLQRRPGRLLVPAAAYLVVAFVALVAAPALVDALQVDPNELELEAPYLAHNIAFTREAYELDRVREESYAADAELTFERLASHDTTLRNIRLWDPRLLIETYRQLQEIRLYYQFYAVDVDRYEIDGMPTQVMLSARELAEELPDRADTWVNRHLQYTHGYGLVMSPVGLQGEEGGPVLYVRDLPPVSVPGLEVEIPGLYYAEHVDDYHLVRTEADEMDYPQGDDNVYTRYEGLGGVPLGGFGRRLAFSFFLSDFNLMLSDYITPETRIQIWQSVRERIRRVAPFLLLDADPYLVLSEGRLYWIQDAYTAAATFPYAEPAVEGFNYLRNTVKVVVDAYDGTVDLYVTTPDEPVLSAYRRVFPMLFKTIDDLSEDLRRHLRYPDDLFRVQVEKYNRYHMTNAQVFYNNEDLWERPLEVYGGQETAVRPYHLLMRLPEEPEAEFLLLTPLTPRNRHNMIAWIAARSDPPHYGELVVYKLPKERLIYGPSQIEARIDQDTKISEQLSLWDQRGSRVIRGNLLVVPIGGAFLYVEPIFLIAESTEIPQLQRVIVAFGERVVMAPTLEEALRAVMGRAPAPPPAPAGEATEGVGEGAAMAEARAALARATEALRAGDFAAFGRALEELRTILE